MDNATIFSMLATVGVLLTVFYWARRSLVPGILSVLAMWATGAYWLILETSLPVLAWVWYAVALANFFDFVLRVAFTFGDMIADRYGYKWDFLRSKEDDY